ncbi:DNA (cytosine-5-)-methyltransferase [Flavobacteriaceae bacterium 3-367]
MKGKRLNVLELFAGVGGFRLGLESSGNFQVIWSNQWEPSTKAQHASSVYESRFGAKNHYNVNIEEVPISNIPDHDLLVGGFPCQDYSVATSLHNAKGLQGKKGVLWWSIHNILKHKKKKPHYLFLENVDRLLKSPVKQRGRDFAIMLKSLDDLGYAMEWRVINAADYGMPQRRKRIFLMGYHRSTALYHSLEKTPQKDWMLTDGVLANAFPIESTTAPTTSLKLEGNLVDISQGFNLDKSLSPFLNTGTLINGKVFTLKTMPAYTGPKMVLGDILQNGEVDRNFLIPKEDLPKWEYLKGAKKEGRKAKNGFSYQYSEGSMTFPDDINAASRTIITGEGGKSPSRFKHVVQSPAGLRRLTPVELERLNMFPDNHTKKTGVSDAKRAFLMGNALVVGIVEKIGASLYAKINS